MNKLEKKLKAIESELGSTEPTPEVADKLGWHLDYIESLIGGSGGDVKLKTLNEESLKGEGNISIPVVTANPELVGTEDTLNSLQVGNTKFALGGGSSTVLSFKSSWPTDNQHSLYDLLTAVSHDSDVKVGQEYFGEVNLFDISPLRNIALYFEEGSVSPYNNPLFLTIKVGPFTNDGLKYYDLILETFGAPSVFHNFVYEYREKGGEISLEIPQFENLDDVVVSNTHYVQDEYGHHTVNGVKYLISQGSKYYIPFSYRYEISFNTSNDDNKFKAYCFSYAQSSYGVINTYATMLPPIAQQMGLTLPMEITDTSSLNTCINYVLSALIGAGASANAYALMSAVCNMEEIVEVYATEGQYTFSLIKTGTMTSPAYIDSTDYSIKKFSDLLSDNNVTSISFML